MDASRLGERRHFPRDPLAASITSLFVSARTAQSATIGVDGNGAVSPGRCLAERGEREAESRGNRDDPTKVQ